MPKLSASTHIAKSPDDVFKLFADIGNADKYVSGIRKVEMLTDGPVGVGTRFRETRVMFNREATEEMEVTSFDPGKSYRVETKSHGAHYTSTFQFKPEGEGTNVTVDFKVEPVSMLAKLMTPISRVMTESTRKLLQQDLDDIKTYAENE